MFTGPLAPALAAPTAEHLRTVLALRPDALHPPAPRSLDELQERLGDPWSVSMALVTAPLPALQLVEALVALGGSAPLGDLLTLLGVDEEAGRAARAATDGVLGWLDDRALVTRDGDQVRAASGASAIFPSPLRLGPPLRSCLADVPARELTAILRRLGVALPTSRARAALAGEVVAVLTDAPRVRALAAAAPPGVAAELAALAGADSGDGPPGGQGTGALQRRRAASGWAGERGLLLREPLGWTTVMPAEVALALRGEAWRAPFAPLPPDLPTHGVDAARVASASSAAAWPEAERLGVIELGALSPLGRTLLAGDSDALVRATTAMAPSATARVAAARWCGASPRGACGAPWTTGASATDRPAGTRCWSGSWVSTRASCLSRCATSSRTWPAATGRSRCARPWPSSTARTRRWSPRPPPTAR